MSAMINTNAIRAFELARVHNPYSTYAATTPLRESDSESASSLGCDDYVAPYKPQQVIATSTAQIKPQVPSRSESVQLFALAMTYLPLKDINVAREAAPLLAEAANHVAPRPFERTDVTFIRWQPTEVPHPVAIPSFRRPTPGAPNNFSWRCLGCGNLTYGPRCCSVCRAPINGASCRVFLGQLRKDLTAELTSYMLRSVAPQLNILHVESHTNPNDGRGRGCAWVYVDTVADAVLVTELHKRVFVDVDAEGYEGFWYVENPELVPVLNRMADAVSNAHRRPMTLPRQPMVAELPAKSILAEIVANSPFKAQH